MINIRRTDTEEEEEETDWKVSANFKMSAAIKHYQGTCLVNLMSRAWNLSASKPTSVTTNASNNLRRQRKLQCPSASSLWFVGQHWWITNDNLRRSDELSLSKEREQLNSFLLSLPFIQCKICWNALKAIKIMEALSIHIVCCDFKCHNWVYFLPIWGIN